MSHARLATFLEAARDACGSDLHLCAGRPPLVRVDGELRALPYRALDAAELEALVEECADAADREALVTHGTRVLAFDAGAVGRARVSLTLHQGGLGAVLRLVPRHVPRLAELGLPRVVSELARLRNGLILITSPAGQGRTTTAAALVRTLLEQDRTVITLEDPIEFVHATTHGTAVQRAIGHHVASRLEGLREARQDGAEAVLVGDLTDCASLEAALETATNGSLVIATLPTRGAIATLERLSDGVAVDALPTLRRSLAGTLRAVVSQQLVRCADGRGRRAAHEILIIDDQVGPLVRDGRLLQIGGAIANGRRLGMQTMDASLLALVRAGDIDPDDAVLRAQDPWALVPFLTRPERVILASGETRAA